MKNSRTTATIYLVTALGCLIFGYLVGFTDYSANHIERNSSSDSCYDNLPPYRFWFIRCPACGETNRIDVNVESVFVPDDVNPIQMHKYRVLNYHCNHCGWEWVTKPRKNLSPNKETIPTK